MGLDSLSNLIYSLAHISRRGGSGVEQRSRKAQVVSSNLIPGSTASARSGAFFVLTAPCSRRGQLVSRPGSPPDADDTCSCRGAEGARLAAAQPADVDAVAACRA